MAMIGAVDRDWTFPWLGSQGWFALLVDVFATLVLVGVAAAFWIRKVQRPERFKGSHLGEADLILAMIAGIVRHAAPLAREPDRARPERVAGRAGRPSRTRSRTSSATARATEVARARLRVGARPARPRLPRLPAALEAPAHRDRGDQRLVRRARGRAGASSRSTSRSRTRPRCASAPRRSPT